MSDAYALVSPETDMKQKRAKSQINELGNKLQNLASTSSGGNVDRTSKSSAKGSECVSGVCSVVWKPDSMKR
jgi:hypothetical protein